MGRNPAGRKAQHVGQGENCVSAGHLQLALRDWRAVFAKPLTWGIVLGVALVLTILAPFGTDMHLRPLLRFLYWTVMVACTYGTGLAISLALDGKLPAGWPVLARVAAAGLATGLAITPVITLLNFVAFAYLPSLAEWPGLAGQFLIIALVVTGIIHAVQAQKAPAAKHGPAPLLARLPVERRGPILALSAEDHYTRIHTTQGQALVLIRLSDAIQEAAPVQGLQVHRSHWVARAAVASCRRQGDGALVTLTDGAEIPVSRRYMPDIRAAGLLPK